MILSIYPIELTDSEFFLSVHFLKVPLQWVIHVETYGQYPGKWTAFFN